jgi:hypothetical protein
MHTHRAARRLILPCVLSVAGISLPCTAASVSNLVATHRELDGPSPTDLLTWTGSAQFFEIWQSIEGNNYWSEIEIHYPGGTGSFQYRATPGPMGTITSYFVRAIDWNAVPPADVVAYSNGAGCGELLKDPAFESGPLTAFSDVWHNTYWYQTSDRSPTPSSFVQGPDSSWYYALMGGVSPSFDLIQTYPSAVRAVPGLDPGINGGLGHSVVSSSLNLHAEVLASSTDSRTDFNDVLNAYLIDTTSGSLLAITGLIDNRSTYQIVDWTVPSDTFVGKPLQVAFGAYNNATLPTTFTLYRFDLSVSLVFDDI